MDADLVFNEVTSNFQAVTIQGQFTYRIHNPKRAAELLNFTMDPRTQRHVSNDPDRLAQRITNIIQMETRTEIQKRRSRRRCASRRRSRRACRGGSRSPALLEPLGVELLSVYFVAAKPTPEVAKALEAEYRETLLRKADMAISARRAAAVEEERKIKENELNTEIALEERAPAAHRPAGRPTSSRRPPTAARPSRRRPQYRARAKQRELAALRASWTRGRCSPWP